VVGDADCDREDVAGGVYDLYSNMSASKNEHGMKYTPFVEYLRGRELDGFIEHAQDIRVIFLIVSRFLCWMTATADRHRF
jgi:hypothetical protein